MTSLLKKPIDSQSTEWWTGKPPVFGQCPGMQEDGTLHSLPTLSLAAPSRQTLLNYFDNSWTLTEVLFSGLRSEAAFMRSPVHNLRHPLIFYYGHPAVLYVNKLRVAGILNGPVNPYFETYFETGVDEMSWDDLSKNERTWAPLADVHAYRQQVYDTVRNLIVTHPAFDPAKAPFLEDTQGWALAMGFEHERIHLETSSVLIRELPVEHVRRPKAWPADAPSGKTAAANTWRTIRAESVHLGKSRDVPFFGWDNEYGRREVQVPEFEASSQLISNGEFAAFVRGGGYREKKYWSDAGWQWRQFRNTKWPTFWVPDGPSGSGLFKLRRTFEVTAMEPSWPAVVNFYEARAYGAWKAEQDGASHPYRLTTEAEHRRLRPESLKDDAVNSNLRFGSESAVDNHIVDGTGDPAGNVWQWCEDEANPLDGFKAHPYYDDFSTPCFDGKHQMILGGSFVSSGDEASRWARFHFRPHFFQHAGFRLVKSPAAAATAVRLSDTHAAQAKQSYEDDALVSQYMDLHYGLPSEVLPFAQGPREALGFPRRSAEIVNEVAKAHGISLDRALDLGCAVGGATFELARTFANVDGVDLSAAFIRQAEELKEHGEAGYHRIVEGSTRSRFFAHVDPMIDRTRVRFRQADALALPDEYSAFDAVLMANVLCRLSDPRAALARMSGPKGLVKRGGILVLLSPYSWLADYTPTEKWLGGTDGNRGAETIKSILSTDFTLLKEENVPALLREHERKYQYIVPHLTVWQRR